MKVFITGGNGFIGSRVVKLCVERGHDVTCLLRHTSRTKRIAGVQYTPFIGDIRDAAGLEKGLSGHDACIHLASVSAWTDMRSDVLDAIVLGGTAHVLAACAANEISRVVHVSSAVAINGSPYPRVFDEDAVFELGHTSMRYAIAKHEAEGLVQAEVARGHDVIIVNPAEVYGPEDDDLVTAGNLKDALTSWPALACYGGTAVTHVDDVAEAIVAALHKGQRGQRYILGGDNLSVQELIQLTLRLGGQKKPVLPLPNQLLKWGINSLARLRLPTPVAPEVLDYATYYFFMDSSKAIQELGYRPRPAVQVLKPVVQWLRDAGHV